MQIVSSSLQLNSAHRKSEQSIENERLRVWIDNPGNPPRQPAPQGAARFTDDRTTLSPIAQATQPVKKQGNITDEPTAPTVELKFNALIQLVERLTGKKLKIFNPSDMDKNPEAAEAPKQPPRAGEAPPARTGETPPARAGFGIEYDYYAARIEEESSHFSATGTVKTADGKEINIELELTMSRRFMEEQSISIREGDAVQKVKDPLVLNFNGSSAELTETKFSFDLDSDGRNEQISLLNSDSGFLALDKNGDGTINNGNELFGTQSGNGFADLAAYDQDGNQWIDENDDVYAKLRIWNRDANGNDQLIALGQKGVGAIYLGNITTPFDLTDKNNQLLGQVASSGLFLKEEGGVGTVQQLNLVV